MTETAHVSEDGRKQTVVEHLNGTAELAEQFAAVFGAGGYGQRKKGRGARSPEAADYPLSERCRPLAHIFSQPPSYLKSR